jgi:hypothetical protein
MFIHISKFIFFESWCERGKCSEVEDVRRIKKIFFIILGGIILGGE